MQHATQRTLGSSRCGRSATTHVAESQKPYRAASCYLRRIAMPAAAQPQRHEVAIQEPEQDEQRRLSSHGAGSSGKNSKQQERTSTAVGSGLALGPISLSFAKEFGDDQAGGAEAQERQNGSDGLSSIHSMTTAEWRAKYEKDGTIDLWVEEEFNAGSRLVGGRAVHLGGVAGIRTGEGPTLGAATKHKIKIHDHYGDQVVEVEVPEDRYILWEAEDKGLELPYACRMGCCTACAVRVVEGEMWQPEALGISQELKEQGYGLMCVGFPLTDMVLETVPEDEVYDLQFGGSFAALATNPRNNAAIERDDFALEIANMDE